MIFFATTRLRSPCSEAMSDCIGKSVGNCQRLLEKLLCFGLEVLRLTSSELPVQADVPAVARAFSALSMSSVTLRARVE